MLTPVTNETPGTVRKLHPTPGILGKIAAETAAGTLLLSHFMARSLKNVDQDLEVIHSRQDESLLGANGSDVSIICDTRPVH